MASPPKFTAFRTEDYQGAPQWFATFLRILNELLTSMADAFNAHLTRSENLQAGEKTGVGFTGGSVVPVAYSMPTRPKHVVVTQLGRDDGVAIAGAWSMTWKLNQKNQIELTFQGLSATTYTCNITYE